MSKTDLKSFTGSVYNNRNDNIIQIDEKYYYRNHYFTNKDLEEITGKKYIEHHTSIGRCFDHGGYINSCIVARFLKYNGRFGSGYKKITRCKNIYVYVTYLIESEI